MEQKMENSPRVVNDAAVRPNVHDRNVGNNSNSKHGRKHVDNKLLDPNGLAKQEEYFLERMYQEGKVESLGIGVLEELPDDHELSQC